jgi:hypothetical protein
MHVLFGGLSTQDIFVRNEENCVGTYLHGLINSSPFLKKNLFSSAIINFLERLSVSIFTHRFKIIYLPPNICWKINLGMQKIKNSPLQVSYRIWDRNHFQSVSFSFYSHQELDFELVPRPTKDNTKEPFQENLLETRQSCKEKQRWDVARETRSQNGYLNFWINWNPTLFRWDSLISFQ